MNDEVLIFIPQFIDRSGDTVYNIHRRREGRYTMPGDLIGQARFTPKDSVETCFEWIPEETYIATKEGEESS